MRNYYLDFTRAVLMMLGVVYHAAMVFTPYHWLISSDNQSMFFVYVTETIHSFRMQGFYIISGFFTAFMLNKYVGNKFIINRMVRLGVPTVFCGITFNSIMNYFSRNQNRNNLKPFGVDYFLGGEWLGHLWFLPNLMLYILILYSLINIYPKLRHFKISGSQSYLFLQLFTFFFAAVAGVAIKIFPISPFGGYWIFWGKVEFFYYLPFFWVGVVCCLDNELFDCYLNSIKINTLLILILFGIIYFLHANAMFKNLEILLQFPLALCINGVLLYFARKYFNTGNNIIKVMSDSSYTIYLLHQPLLVVLAYFIVRVNVNMYCQFVILFSTTFLISSIIHNKIVLKFELISFVLNGKTFQHKVVDNQAVKITV